MAKIYVSIKGKLERERERNKIDGNTDNGQNIHLIDGYLWDESSQKKNYTFILTSFATKRNINKFR